MYLGLILIYFMVLYLYNFSDGSKKRVIIGSMLKAKIWFQCASDVV